MSYLELPWAPSLGACFVHAQNKRRGSALWRERCNDASQTLTVTTLQSELHERIVHVETTHRSDLGSQTSSPATSVRLLYVYCALIAFISRSYCAVTVLLRRFMGQLPLILRPHCAATKTMTLVICSRRCSDVRNRFSMPFLLRSHLHWPPRYKYSFIIFTQSVCTCDLQHGRRQAEFANCAAISTYAGTGWPGHCQHCNI